MNTRTKLDAAGACAVALINALSAYGPGEDCPGDFLLETEHALMASGLNPLQLDALREAFEVSEIEGGEATK